MEKNVLVGKTMEELIEIVLEKELADRELRADLDNAKDKLSMYEKKQRQCAKSVCMLCALLIVMMISVAILLFSR